MFKVGPGIPEKILLSCAAEIEFGRGSLLEGGPGVKKIMLCDPVNKNMTSRKHGVIRKINQNTYVISDYSTNGILINGKKLKKGHNHQTQIHELDIITFGLPISVLNYQFSSLSSSTTTITNSTTILTKTKTSLPVPDEKQEEEEEEQNSSLDLSFDKLFDSEPQPLVQPQQTSAQLHQQHASPVQTTTTSTPQENLQKQPKLNTSSSSSSSSLLNHNHLNINVNIATTEPLEKINSQINKTAQIQNDWEWEVSDDDEEKDIVMVSTPPTNTSSVSQEEQTTTTTITHTKKKPKRDLALLNKYVFKKKEPKERKVRKVLNYIRI